MIPASSPDKGFRKRLRVELGNSQHHTEEQYTLLEREFGRQLDGYSPESWLPE